MLPLTFFGLIAENTGLYLGCVFACLILVALMYRTSLIGNRWQVFDPFMLYLIGVVFSAAAVYFMYFIGETTPRDAQYFTLSQFVFWLGYMVFHISPRRLASIPRTETLYSRGERMALYVVCGLLLVLGTAFILRYGLSRAEDQSRLDLYQVAGVGALDKIISGLIFAFIVLLYRLQTLRYLPFLEKLFLVYPTLVVAVLYLLSTGSKGALFIFASVWFIFAALARLQNASPPRAGSKLSGKASFAFLVALFAAIFVYNQYRGGAHAVSSVGVFELLGRFILAGDIFVYAYPSGWFDAHRASNGFAAVFSEVLGTLRIMPWTGLPQPLGYQVMLSISPIDYFAGPNPIHPVFGYHYFGPIGGLVYSATIGSLIGASRRFVITFRNRTALRTLLAVGVYFSATLMATDIASFWKNLFGIALGAFLILLTAPRAVPTRTQSLIPRFAKDSGVRPS